MEKKWEDAVRRFVGLTRGDRRDRIAKQVEGAFRDALAELQRVVETQGQVRVEPPAEMPAEPFTRVLDELWPLPGAETASPAAEDPEPALHEVLKRALAKEQGDAGAEWPAMSEVLRAIDREFRDADSIVDRVSERVDTLAERTTEEVAPVKAATGELRESLTTLDAFVGKLDRQLSDALTGIGRQLDLLDRRVSALDERAERAQKAVDSLQFDVPPDGGKFFADLDRRVGSLERNVAGHEASLGSLARAGAAAGDEGVTLRGQVYVLRSALEDVIAAGDEALKDVPRDGGGERTFTVPAGLAGDAGSEPWSDPREAVAVVRQLREALDVVSRPDLDPIDRLRERLAADRQRAAELDDTAEALAKSEGEYAELSKLTRQVRAELQQALGQRDAFERQLQDAKGELADARGALADAGVPDARDEDELSVAEGMRQLLRRLDERGEALERIETAAARRLMVAPEGAAAAEQRVSQLVAAEQAMSGAIKRRILRLFETGQSL